jgi:RimJ/RimL family protein N-acetyltransferase
VYAHVEVELIGNYRKLGYLKDSCQAPCFDEFKEIMSDISFVEYDLVFLEKSWLWLNDPEVKALTMTPDFTQDQQRRWFDSLKTNDKYEVFGIRAGNFPIGACGLKNITADEAEYWGYIGEKIFWGKGVGKLMVLAMLELAVQRNIPKVWLRVSRENHRAVSLYEKLGFATDRSVDSTLIMSITPANILQSK